MFRKASNKTKFFSLLTVDTSFFLNKSRTRRFSFCVPKKFYRKLSCFYYSPWIQLSSKQMQDNTLLTVCTKKLLLTQSFLLLTVDTKFFLEKSGREDSHRVYQKTSIKTDLFIILTLDTIPFYIYDAK